MTENAQADHRRYFFTSTNAGGPGREFHKMIQLLLNITTPPFQLLPMPKVD